MTQPIQTIAVGQRIPQVSFQMKLDDGIGTFSTYDYLKDSRVVLFVVPGAFTPTCSAKHLPGFIKLADKLKAAGIDKIACMAVNDAHVMRAWAEAGDACALPRCIRRMQKVKLPCKGHPWWRAVQWVKLP